MLKQVKLYKYHTDYHDNMTLHTFDAISQPTRYKLLNSDMAYRFRTFIEPTYAYESVEEAYYAAHKRIVERVAVLSTEIVKEKLMLKKLEELNPTKA